MQSAVKVVVYDNNDNILVLRRSDGHPTLALHPDLPGGVVDPGENMVEAAIRELQEETGLILKQHEITQHQSLDVAEGATWGIFFGRIDAIAPQISISWEHDKYSWMSVSDFLNMQCPTDPDYMFNWTRECLGDACLPAIGE